MRKVLFISLLALLVAESAWTQNRAKVYVSQFGKDSVGSQLAYAVREELRKSTGYQLGTEDDCLFTIRLVTVDNADFERDEGRSSAIATAFTMANVLPYQAGNPQTWLPIYLNAGVRSLGRDRVPDAAKAIVAALDAEVQDFRDAARQK